MKNKEILGLRGAYASIYSNLSESHFKVGDEVICKNSGMEGEVVKVDSEEKGKYYTVKREDGKMVKYAPDELKLESEEKEEDEKKMKEEVELGEDAAYDRNRKRAAQRAQARNEARARGQTGSVPGVGYVSPRPERATYTDSAGVVRHHTGARMPNNEEVETDLFDYILEHLVAEGYADTNKAALAIMANMSEEWREDIVEELTGERRTRALEKGGYLANRVARGKEGQPLERRNRGGDVTMRTTTKGPTKRGGIGFKGKSKSDWYGGDDTHGSGNKSRRRRGLEVKDTSDDL